MKKRIQLTITLLASLFSNLIYSKESPKVLIVVTSHTKLGNTNQSTGFWLPELTHPYYALVREGIDVDVASPKGGMAPIDNKSFEEEDVYNNSFLKDPILMRKVIQSTPLNKVDSKDYSAIIFAGGSGAMWDFPNNRDINRLAREVYERNGLVSSICHGAAALVGITLSNGKKLVKEKKVAAFTKEEEIMINQIDIIPFLLEDKLEESGATHISGKAWQENVIVDGKLITGQNPASALKVAKEVIKLLK